jgi:UDP-N-acetylmuramoyl-tripeptide--D-alanyl-D-alanine ligase
MKRIGITLEDVFNLKSAVIYNPDNFETIRNVSIDSRNISGKCLFVAIKGERLDGHDFVDKAVLNGSVAVLVDKKKLEKLNDPGVTVIAVKDTTKTLGELAGIWRRKLSAKVIGITGSAGKTSTKEMVAMLLSKKYKVNKTFANHNNHIGVPLTIFSTNEKHDILIAEMGTNHFGEIEYTANIALPDYAMITNIGDSHLEFLLNRKGVLREKTALFKATAKMNGTLFINEDDNLLKKVAKGYGKKVTYGFNSNSSIRGKITGFNDDGRPEIEIAYKKNKMRVESPLYGEANAKNILAAAAVAFTMGLSVKEISEGIKELSSIDKRLNVRRKKDYLLIDDTYNASPSSMKEAINLAGRVKLHKRKIAILGDMLELGQRAAEFHRKLSAPLRSNKFEEVYLIGPLMKNLYEDLKKKTPMVKYFRSRKELHSFLKILDLSDSVILVKGSRRMKMEEFIRTIKEKAG